MTPRLWTLGFKAAALLLFLLPTAAKAANPDALWQIVATMCVPDQQQHHDPKPCTSVDLSQGINRGFVVLKDIVGATQFLLIPTARISGIESPQILAPDAPNYFAEAWAARFHVEEMARKPLPRDAISLAINSVPGRSQNQLHIHVDCIRSDVRDVLRQRLATIGEHWAPLGVPLAGHPYQARRLDGETLGINNPFRLLAEGLPGARGDMANQTLLVTGAVFADGTPGFIFLADHASPVSSSRGSSEELQDHGCALARS